MKAWKESLDIRIVQRYALASAFATAMILGHYLISSLRGTGTNLGLEVQAFSAAVLGVILLTSIMGLVFHQLKVERKARNSYALVFASGMAKLLVTVMVLHVLFA